MPPSETELLDGQLAWRQHTGGHEDRSNMKHFIAWVSKQLNFAPTKFDRERPKKLSILNVQFGGTRRYCFSFNDAIQEDNVEY